MIIDAVEYDPKKGCTETQVKWETIPGFAKAPYAFVVLTSDTRTVTIDGLLKPRGVGVHIDRVFCDGD
jgi:hypothetical protein